MDRYSRLSQYISEGNTEKAEELFRTLVIDTARTIYEGMESIEDLDDNEDWIGGDAADDLIADVSSVEDGKNMEESSIELKPVSKPKKPNKIGNNRSPYLRNK